MAVTKIWAIKDSLSRVVDYAANPDKTIYSDLQKIIHYAENGEKTVSGDEKACFVTGVNCNADTAYEEMHAVQKRFNKVGGNVAYHAYQSFKTGEVTPEQCHRIGVQLAKDMWGADYQVLVATHFNTGTYHNHFVINSVNMWTGKKFDCNKKAYYKFRDLSDKLCEKEQLTVIKNPSGKTPRSLYFAEKRGEPTKYNLMRIAIDYAISISLNQAQFRKALEKQGYIINLDPRLKYATIRSVNDTKNTRLYHLGEQYDREGIFNRMRENDVWIASEKYSVYIQSTKPKTIQPKKYVFKSSFSKTKKITELKALYLYYCYRLGYLPKKNQRKPLSPEMKQAWRKIDKISNQVRLISKHNLNDIIDVENFISSNNKQIIIVKQQRDKIYNKLRRCKDTDKISSLKSDRDVCSDTLKRLRTDNRVAKSILNDIDEIKSNIESEINIQHQRFSPTKQKRRELEYDR
ncbi:MAG: relaxase/mobilization nuclease domain-containing protein [Eubacterium sp.]|nr:relaxase/mobilization nuclease domain-containing protein [Eubacterium sp.]